MTHRHCSRHRDLYMLARIMIQFHIKISTFRCQRTDVHNSSRKFIQQESHSVRYLSQILNSLLKLETMFSSTVCLGREMQHSIYTKNPSKQMTDGGQHFGLKLLLNILFKVVCGKTFFTSYKEKGIDSTRWLHQPEYWHHFTVGWRSRRISVLWIKPSISIVALRSAWGKLEMLHLAKTWYFMWQNILLETWKMEDSLIYFIFLYP